jgi:hypothetical protein
MEPHRLASGDRLPINTDPAFGVDGFARAVAQERRYPFRRTRQVLGMAPSAPEQPG